MRFGKDCGAEGLVSKSVEWWLRVVEVWDTGKSGEGKGSSWDQMSPCVGRTDYGKESAVKLERLEVWSE